MTTSNAGVVWRKHVSGKWHAWAPGAEKSACEFATWGMEPEAAVPRSGRACLLCCAKVGTPARPPEPPVPQATEPTEVVEMAAEFVGGKFDGQRLKLGIVEESATKYRVIAMRYEKRFTPVRASEVEHPSEEGHTP